MTKEEFKKRWDSPDGGGITFEDIAKCAVEWGISSRPKTRPMDRIANAVTIAAGCKDIFELWED